MQRLTYEIIFNLCDNAIKYNREGGRVDVSVAREGAGAVVTVADTGIGIAPEHQQRIFERFYRVDKSHSKASGGTGLGLSIVKHAVQYLNGSIALKSEPGKGTTVSVSPPRLRLFRVHGGARVLLSAELYYIIKTIPIRSPRTLYFNAKENLIWKN